MKKGLILFVLICLCACSEDAPLQTVPEYPSASELKRMLDDGNTTSVAIVTELLARARQEESLNAFISLDAEGALERARELDDMREDGETLGPLHGIPIVIKDNIHAAGLRNTAGTPGLNAFRPANDSAIVGKLRDAGAIILAKTNMHELAFGITSDNAAYGSVANPYNVQYFAGGSSGGTASAIAAGLAPAGLGTDTGGSVRIPAALTGIVGYRPTSGRYDSSAVTPISHTRDTIGLMAPTVADIVLMDSAVVAATNSVAAVAADEIRLGVPRDYYFANLDAQTAVLVESALSKLSEAGVVLVDADPDDIESLMSRSGFPIALYEVVRDLPAYLEKYETGQYFENIAEAALSPDVQGLFAMLGTAEGQVPDEIYADALAAREEMRRVFAASFEQHDLDAMIFPTTPLPARPIEGSLETVELNGEQVPTFPTYIRNTDPASIAALPGISLPIGLTADGLPVGIEIDGPEGSDRALMEIAATLERVFDVSVQPGVR